MDKILEDKTEDKKKCCKNHEQDIGKDGKDDHDHDHEHHHHEHENDKDVNEGITTFQLGDELHKFEEDDEVH